jgi:DNA-binding transcriptional regulator YdaS (Cro superfamily)
MNIYPIKDPVVFKEDAIKAAGSASKLARILSVCRATVSAWGEEIPPYHAYRILQAFPDLKQD